MIIVKILFFELLNSQNCEMFTRILFLQLPIQASAAAQQRGI